MITKTDSTELVPGMTIAMHPNFTNRAQTVGASIADTYIVQEQGPAVRGSQLDQQLTRIERTV